MGALVSAADASFFLGKVGDPTKSFCDIEFVGGFVNRDAGSLSVVWTMNNTQLPQSLISNIDMYIAQAQYDGARARLGVGKGGTVWRLKTLHLRCGLRREAAVVQNLIENRSAAPHSLCATPVPGTVLLSGNCSLCADFFFRPAVRPPPRAHHRL